MTDDWLATHSAPADRIDQAIKDRLIRAMENSGKTQRETGKALGWDEAKVSKTLRGNRTPTAADIKAWAEVTGESDESRDETLRLLTELQAVRKTWKDRLRAGRAPVQLEYSKLYAESKYFQILQVGVIPGILQIAEYARQIFIDLDQATPDTPRNVDADVQARLSRAQYLYDLNKQFDILVTEAALRYAVADPQVMVAQLDRLISVTSMPNVRFGVIPLMMRIHTIVQTGFVVYDDLAIVEDPVDHTQYRGEEARILAGAMARHWSDAVEGEDARALIRSVMDDFTSG